MKIVRSRKKKEHRGLGGEIKSISMWGERRRKRNEAERDRICRSAFQLKGSTFFFLLTKKT